MDRYFLLKIALLSVLIARLFVNTAVISLICWDAFKMSPTVSFGVATICIALGIYLLLQFYSAIKLVAIDKENYVIIWALAFLDCILISLDVLGLHLVHFRPLLDTPLPPFLPHFLLFFLCCDLLSAILLAGFGVQLYRQENGKVTYRRVQIVQQSTRRSTAAISQ